MDKFIIGCDADGVLTDLSAHNLRAGRQAFHREPVNPDSYSLEDIFDVSDIPKLRLYMKAFSIYRRYCKYEPPRPDAAKTIRDLSAQGYEFHSITARKFAANRNILGYIARYWYTKWLKNNGIGFKSVLFCDEVKSKHDKLLGCRRLGVDAMIEDRPDNALYLAENGIKVIMPETPYNRETAHKNIIPVKEWSGIRETLLRLPGSEENSFSKLEREQLNSLSDSEKNEYFRLYQRHLQQTELDLNKLRKSDRRFHFLYRLMKLPVKLICHGKVFGREMIPYQDGFIIACNHCDSSDQYRLGLALGNRPFVGYAAKEIEHTFRGRLFSMTGLGIFIDRSSHENKKAAVEKMTVYAAHGRTALIFPEGTRKNKTPEGRTRFQNRFKAGTAALAQKTGTGILPVAVNSFGRYFLVRFGELIYVSPTDSIDDKTRDLEKAVAELSFANYKYYMSGKGMTKQLAEITEKYKNYIYEINNKG